MHTVLKTKIWIYVKYSFGYVKQWFSHTINFLGEIFTPKKYNRIAVVIKPHICIQKRLHRWSHQKLSY